MAEIEREKAKEIEMERQRDQRRKRESTAWRCTISETPLSKWGEVMSCCHSGFFWGDMSLSLFYFSFLVLFLLFLSFMLADDATAHSLEQHWRALHPNVNIFVISMNECVGLIFLSLFFCGRIIYLFLFF